MYQPKVTVKTAAEVKAILGKDFPSQVAKIIDHIDSHCRAWIERCPFVVISSTNAAGAMDVSPTGDPPGFVKVLDKHTLAVPDRMGNHRGDTFLNVLENPSVGLLFIVPKRREVVRVSGEAQVVRDPELLETHGGQRQTAGTRVTRAGAGSLLPLWEVHDSLRNVGAGPMGVHRRIANVRTGPQGSRQFVGPAVGHRTRGGGQ
jgi:predicted pyridoxine 5'-phosphate oxidase superfamily flavin-nucleotide-binding protein